MIKLLKNILYGLTILGVFIPMYLIILAACLIPSGLTLCIIGAVSGCIPDVIAANALTTILLLSFIITVPVYIYTVYKGKDDIKSVIKN